MSNKLTKIRLIGQVAFSVSVTIFGIAYGLRGLFAGDIFCAVLFGFIGYASGYKSLYKASIIELREYNRRIGK